MKKILHIVGAMAPGGFENFIMNVYRRVDRGKIRFDFIVHRKKEGSYDEEIEALGGNLFYVTRKSVNPLKNFLEIKRIVRGNHYDMVCRHSDNAFTVVDLLAARLAGAKEVAMHSHSTTTGHQWIHAFFRIWMPFVTTRRFACSQGAGRWMFGGAKFTLVPNAIDTGEFLFLPEIRSKMQREWGTTGKTVYGHVGNFAYAKNHLFLLEVFQRIAGDDDEAVLFLVGDGELRAAIEEKIARLGLRDRVILTGRRKNAADFFCLFDVLIFPSVYEGLPVSLVEAQASGLPCLVSDRITGEAALTDCITALPLSACAEEWAAKARGLSSGKEGRHSRDKEIREAGYDIGVLVDFYEHFDTLG